MEIRNLSREAFLDTLCEPMRRLSEGESYRPIPLKDYVSQCIRLEALPTTVSRIEIHHVYLSGDCRHTHVLFYFGKNNCYLVVVVSHEPDFILGYHMLNLRKEYGLT